MKHNVFICHKNCIHIYNQTPLFERVHLMTNISASAACIQQTVCPTTHATVVKHSFGSQSLWQSYGVFCCVSVCSIAAAVS